MGYYLGIDLGTSSLKVSLSDEKGNIIDTESRSYPLIMPKLNWSEQDPDEWFEAMIQALATLNVRNGLDKVRSLSFSGQMHGLVILDKNDKVIRNAILWNDSRTTKEVDFLNTAIGKKKLIEETSNIAICGFTAPKILWVKNNEPENFEHIAKIMLPKDYLTYKLSGVFASDYSDLSGTLFFNVKEKQYSSYMLNVLGIKIDQLPKIYKSYDCIGTVLPKYKHLIGLNENTKVVIGGGDQAVGAIGTNTIKENEISISLGTSGVVFAPIDKYSYDKDGAIHCLNHATGNYHLMGCTLSAMASLKWFFEEILKTTDYVGELDSIDEEITDIIFLPYLCGERSPINDPLASGYFSNLALFYKRKDLIKALIEGIVFSLYDCYNTMVGDGINASYARCIGGGTKSKRILQILADVFGIEIRTISTSDGGALGAIILAMVGDGLYPSLKVAAGDLIKDKESFKPNKDKHLKYLDKFKEYKNLYLKVKK